MRYKKRPVRLSDTGQKCVRSGHIQRLEIRGQKIEIGNPNTGIICAERALEAIIISCIFTAVGDIAFYVLRVDSEGEGKFAVEHFLGHLEEFHVDGGEAAL